MILIFCRDHPSLMIMLFYPQSVCYLKRFFPGKERRSGIPLFLCIVPIQMISRQLEILKLSLRQLYFLQAYGIRL